MAHKRRAKPQTAAEDCSRPEGLLHAHCEAGPHPAQVCVGSGQGTCMAAASHAPLGRPSQGTGPSEETAQVALGMCVAIVRHHLVSLRHTPLLGAA